MSLPCSLALILVALNRVYTITTTAATAATTLLATATIPTAAATIATIAMPVATTSLPRAIILAVVETFAMVSKSVTRGARVRGGLGPQRLGMVRSHAIH